MATMVGVTMAMDEDEDIVEFVYSCSWQPGRPTMMKEEIRNGSMVPSTVCTEDEMTQFLYQRSQQPLYRSQTIDECRRQSRHLLCGDIYE